MVRNLISSEKMKQKIKQQKGKQTLNKTTFKTTTAKYIQFVFLFKWTHYFYVEGKIWMRDEMMKGKTQRGNRDTKQSWASQTYIPQSGPVIHSYPDSDLLLFLCAQFVCKYQFVFKHQFVWSRTDSWNLFPMRYVGVNSDFLFVM